MKGFVVVLCTAPRGKARELARALVDERLAACVNVVPVLSVFRWEGNLEEAEEELMVIKTTEGALRKLIPFLADRHPYRVPEIVALDITQGAKDYLNWVREEVEG